ncbi:glucose/mannose transport system substrate-binding protein [Gracilibacillus halotolerans]|uniref:Probable sugar-binding periplasmic protein n=1 Tax=Gracilibacillus halotolerans TaxID=74386 RepID=A0A841RUH8_9BACI|nr:ABC transporter substrate-binding protein [Gracilibacillus halotolerans]MBB6514128.1 glucose/mannose transport system substrate-binding protein [Gracilibacillus halotolerans]
MLKRSLSLLFMMVVISLLVACGSDSESSNDAADENASNEETDNNSESTGSGEGGTLEIFSWWTGAGEEDGLLALIDLFESKYPDVAVENAAVAGGAGTNAKAVLAARMQGNDPPSTFQVHGGAELNESWVAADMMEPLNDFYEEYELMDKFPEELIDLVSKDGNIYSVPVNIHRGNVIFYNKAVFEDNGISEPTTLDEFMDVLQQLQDAGVTPLAMGDKEAWTATQIFENLLLATLGPDDYRNLWTGDVAFDDDRIVEAAEYFKTILGYVNEDHASRNWQDAAQLVGEGEAGMTNMGDWAKGYFSNDLELETNVDFGYFAFPGTTEDFMVITDTFGLPKGVEDPELVKEFLNVLASAEGQDAFNPLKGSIPARVDADPSKYDEYGTDTMEDFQNSNLTPSLAHGSAASEGFLTKVNQEVNIFVTQQNVEQFIEKLVQAAGDL